MAAPSILPALLFRGSRHYITINIRRSSYHDIFGFHVKYSLFGNVSQPEKI
jgi:hypothetical protein